MHPQFYLTGLVVILFMVASTAKAQDAGGNNGIERGGWADVRTDSSEEVYDLDANYSSMQMDVGFRACSDSTPDEMLFALADPSGSLMMGFSMREKFLTAHLAGESNSSISIFTSPLSDPIGDSCTQNRSVRVMRNVKANVTTVIMLPLSLQASMQVEGVGGDQLVSEVKFKSEGGGGVDWKVTKEDLDAEESQFPDVAAIDTSAATTHAYGNDTQFVWLNSTVAKYSQIQIAAIVTLGEQNHDHFELKLFQSASVGSPVVNVKMNCTNLVAVVTRAPGRGQGPTTEATNQGPTTEAAGQGPTTEAASNYQKREIKMSPAANQLEAATNLESRLFGKCSVERTVVVMHSPEARRLTVIVLPLTTQGSLTIGAHSLGNDSELLGGNFRSMTVKPSQRPWGAVVTPVPVPEPPKPMTPKPERSSRRPPGRRTTRPSQDKKTPPNTQLSKGGAGRLSCMLKGGPGGAGGVVVVLALYYAMVVLI